MTENVSDNILTQHIPTPFLPTSEAFSAKTLELVNSPSLLKTVALTAKNLVHTEFNSDTFVKKHLQLYKEVGLQAQ